MSFVQKLANYLANEIITKRLARSQVFQNAAYKTHKHVSKAQKMASEVDLNDAAKHVGKTVGNTVSTAQKGAAKNKGFFDEFAEEFFRVPGGKK